MVPPFKLSRSPMHEPAPLQGRTILVADDERHLTHVVKRALERAGAEVLVAHDGDEAFDLAVSGRPACIVTDYQMPRVTGLDLARRLFADAVGRGIPVILLTARQHRVDAGELAETNIKGIVNKPFSAIRLVEQVASLLSNASQSRTNGESKPDKDILRFPGSDGPLSQAG